jgi:hypothetical protein
MYATLVFVLVAYCGELQGVLGDDAFAADPGTTEETRLDPLVAEVYAVALKIFVGVDQAVLVATEPTLGPTKMPVADTALAVRLLSVTRGPLTWAMKVVISTASTKTSCPLSTDKTPWKPLRKKPSLIVGSTPMY